MPSLAIGASRAAGIGVLLSLAVACHKTWAPTPRGGAAPPPSAAPVSYPDELTAAKGWTAPPDPARLAIDMDQLTAFRLLSARSGGMRILVYYNSALSSQVSAWRTPTREVLELDVDEAGTDGARRGRRTLSLSSQVAAEDPAGAKNLDALLAHRIESCLTRILLAADARVMDKALLLRRSAASTGARTLSEAEIRALDKDVDLLLEIGFIPRSPSADGFEVSVRAVRTRDARLLAWSSSANAPTSTAFVAQPHRGYQAMIGHQAISLDERAASALQLALAQVARTY